MKTVARAISATLLFAFLCALYMLFRALGLIA